MSGGAFVTIKVGRAGTAAANVRYMTRERATEGKQERVWTHNVPEYAAHPDHAEREMSYKERTGDLREYARQLEEDEQERPQRGSGEKRTHYRAIYSFDREVTDEKAREMVDEHLAENFPKARAIAALHRDTDNAHVHVQIAARKADDKKLHFNRHTHSRLDERWARIYGQEFGREIEQEHLAKKQLWRDWMREARAAKGRGEEPPPRPKRVAHERNQVEEKRKMHAKQYGLSHADQTGTRDDQRRPTNREQAATTRGERADRPTRSLDGQLAANRGATGSLSQPTTPERDGQPDRQQPGRVSGADRTVSSRNETDARPLEVGGDRPEQTRANLANDARSERADERRVYAERRRDERPHTPARDVHQRVAQPAEAHVTEDRGRDVHQHDSRGAFDRVLSLMATVTDTAVNRGRDEVAGLNRRDAAGTHQGVGAENREHVIPARTERADRSADERRERATTSERTRTNASDPAHAARNQPAQPQITDAAREEAARMINAGRLRAKYLIKVVQIGLKERETGRNAEAERRELQLTMYEMREAENQHVKSYGGQPRAVLMKEERDYLAKHKDAPAQAFTRELVKKELGQAFVIGEARAGERLEKEPERQQQERTREQGFERSR